jgi:hypothetical protein
LVRALPISQSVIETPISAAAYRAISVKHASAFGEAAMLANRVFLLRGPSDLQQAHGRQEAI